MRFCGECGGPLQSGPDASGMIRQYCPACGWQWYDPPVPVTLVVVTTDDGQVVYTRKNSFAPGIWSVVAGFITKGETAEQAALREIKEETGLDAVIHRYMGTHVYEKRPDQIVVAFWAKATGGVLQAGDDVDEVDLGPADPSRCRHGATSWWLVDQVYRTYRAQK